MDLPYFLEMVDLKHRYGSNLRAYHAEWKKSDTHENYFQWLDYGEGKNVELEHCSRQRLEKEQVRYLSREERMQYLIDVEEQGRLRWHKNGERVWTTIDYRDSVEGIVPTDSKVKSYRQDEIAALEPQKSHEVNQLDGADTSSTDSISKASSNDSYDASRRYPDPPGLKRAKGPAKLVHVTPAVILNRLMRTTVKQNTWIFVVDLKMNLYIGIKQSGSFQHSSFLHGTRISAAGLIKVKNGQIRSLSPLSGHYRPPAASFRHFISSLKERNTDMSRVSISKSYAVLVGLEAYLGTKKQAKAVGEGVKLGVEKVVHPEQAKARKEKEKDTSQSAKLEEAKLRELQESRGIGKVIKEVKERVRGEEQERNVTGGPSLSSLLGSRRTKSSPPEGANGISTPDSKEEKRPSSSPTPDQPDRTIESTLAERPLQTQPSAPTSDNVKSNGAIEETESGLPLALSEEENPPTDLTKAIEPGPASRMDNITVGVPNESGENDPPQHNDTIPAG